MPKVVISFDVRVQYRGIPMSFVMFEVIWPAKATLP